MKPDLAQGAIETIERYLEVMPPTIPVNVLEHGAGQSTVWFAQRAEYVLSYESDPQWYTTIGSWLDHYKLTYHTKLLYWPDPPYYLSHDAPRKFHIILVDGRNRVEFAKFAIKYLDENGLFIIDDMEREHYKPILLMLKDAGLDMHMYEKNIKTKELDGEQIGDPYITYTGVYSWLG